MHCGTSFAIALCCALACDGRTVSDPSGQTALDVAVTLGSGLVATATSPTEIDLSWPASSRVTGYQIFRSTNGPGGSYTLLASTVPLAYADTALSSSTQYCYKIRSYTIHNNSTNYSSLSSAACASTPAPPINPPMGIDARPLGSRFVRVTWKDESPNEDGFRVERNLTNNGWTQLVTTAANTTSITDSVAAESVVCYRVSAFGAAGVSPTSAADCTAAPAAPSMLGASADLQAITVRWTDLSAVEDGYAVFRSNSGDTWTQLTSLAPSSTSYRDGAVTPGVSYRYVVRAMKDSGYSDPSSIVERTIPTELPAPPVITYAGYGPAESWTGFPYALTVGWMDTSAVLVDSYRVQQTSDTTAWGASYMSFGSTSYSVGGGFSVAQYFRVMAVNAMGASKPSEVACAESPVAPTNLAATALDQHQIDLTWTDNTQCEYGFLIFRAVATDTAYALIAAVPQNSVSYRDSALDAGTSYWYVIVVEVPNYFDDGYGPNASSGAISATTLSADGLSAGTIAPLLGARPKALLPRLDRSSMRRMSRDHAKARIRPRP